MPPRDPDDRVLKAVRPGGPDEHDGPDMEALARLGDLARTMTADDLELHEPPPGLWAGIAAGVEVGGPDAGIPGGHGGGAGTTPAPHGGRLRPVPPPGPEPGETRHRSTAVPPLARRTWALAGAAAAAVVVLVVGLVVAGSDGGGTEPVATARLEPLGAASPATADLVEAGDRFELEIPLADSDLPPNDGFYEVWLIDDEIVGMVSLGPVRPDGTYSVPSDVDIERYPIVDISVEPPDGDPTHSGTSILRGTLA